MVGVPYKQKIKHNTGGGPNPKPGEVWWVDMMRHDDGGGKGRPVIIRGFSGDTVSIFKCTTKSYGMGNRWELIAPEYAMLEYGTFVHTVPASLPRKNLTRRIGTLCPEDLEMLKL